MQFRVDHETISLCRHAAPIAEVKRSGDRHLTDKVNGAVGRSVARSPGGRTDARRARAPGEEQVTQSATRARGLVGGR